MNTITAGEMLGMHNDLYQICKRFIKFKSEKTTYITDLQKDFNTDISEYLDDWNEETDNKEFITTDRINFLINKVCFNDFLTYEEFSAYVNLLKDELKNLLEVLSETYSYTPLNDYDLADLDDNPQTLEELEINPSVSEEE